MLGVVRFNQGGLLYGSRRLESNVGLTDICEAHSLMEFKAPCGLLTCSLSRITVEEPALR